MAYVPHCFIFDFRSKVLEGIQHTSISYAIAKSLWEYSLFLAGVSKDKSINIMFDIFIISPEGELFHPFPKTTFNHTDLKEILSYMITIHFENPIPTAQNPLFTAIEMCDTSLPVHVFLPSSGYFFDGIVSSIKRRTTINPTSPKIQFVIIGEKNEISEYYSEIGSTIVFENNTDCYFQFFRSLSTDILYPPQIEVLEIGEYEIDCLMYQVIADPIEIIQKDVCKCHNKPLISAKPQKCPVIEKKINQSNITKQLCIGDYAIPLDPEDETKNLLKCVGKIPLENISETYLYGNERILSSSSILFSKIIMEMRETKTALIVKRTNSKIYGGEFFALFADRNDSVIHCKNIANKHQIIRFGESINESPKGICNDPIIKSVNEVDSLISFLLNEE